MYELVSGPLVWAAFLVFVAGALYRLVAMARLARRDKVVYATYSARHGARSLAHWLVPFGTRSMRMRPVFTVLSFAFHVCVLVTPVFLLAHVVLWQQAWGVSWWTLPEPAADVMTLVVVFVCLFFMVRRLAAPEVRNVTTWKDFALALLVMAPFLTGYMAHQQWLPYRPMLIVHIVAGAVWLMVIPFTRLAHMIWFAFTRAFMGSEFGAVRHSRDW
jgi:nitrate reductase gamma subunit